MTYGAIRMLLRQRFPGTSLDLLDQFIMDRHQEILDALQWSRLDRQTAIMTTAEYAEGTVNVAQGSTPIQGTGTVWDSTMEQRLVRIAARDEYYSFTFADATTGALDRAYEGDDDSAATYRINQNLYSLDADVRQVDAVTLVSGPLDRINATKARELYPSRNAYGTPRHWLLSMDSANDRMQVELLPIPTTAMSVFLSLTVDADGLERGTVRSSLLPWERPGCLIAGVAADLKREAKDFGGSDREQGQFNRLLEQMQAIDSRRTGPITMTMSPAYTDHQLRRWNR